METQDKNNVNMMKTRQHRRAESFACHEIEGFTITDEDIALFEMFDREGWTDEQRLSYLLEKASLDADPNVSPDE